MNKSLSASMDLISEASLCESKAFDFAPMSQSVSHINWKLMLLSFLRQLVDSFVLGGLLEIRFTSRVAQC